MKTLVVLLAGSVAAMLQSTWLRDALPPWLVPDISLLLVLFVSLTFSFGGGLSLCFLLGLLADLMSGAPEGWHTMFAICVFALNQGILSQVFVRRSRTAFGLFILDFVLKIPYLLILDTLFRFSIPSYDRLVPVWAGETLVSLALMPVLFDLLSAITGFRGTRFFRKKR